MPSEESRKPDIDNIVRAIRAQLPSMSEEFHVTFLGVFGSYVRGEQAASSDLDLLVEFRTPPTLPEFVRLERRLSELAGVNVDLVMKSALKPNIGERILKEVVGI